MSSTTQWRAAREAAALAAALAAAPIRRAFSVPSASLAMKPMAVGSMETCTSRPAAPNARHALMVCDTLCSIATASATYSPR